MFNGYVDYRQYNGRGDVVGQVASDGSWIYGACYTGFGAVGNHYYSSTLASDGGRQAANTKEQDPTGLINEGMRYRDPQTGTFITRDPLGFKAGINMYTYVHQNPMDSL